MVLAGRAIKPFCNDEKARAVPIAASLDLHANLNPQLAQRLDFTTSSRTHPHVDMRETAARAAATRAWSRRVMGPPGWAWNCAAIGRQP
jgi:microcystin degradation protein MlrC